jgi:hypothetical protein
MFSLLFHKTLPKCKNCIYYIPNKTQSYSKYELGKCKKFGNIYCELARMDDFKCSLFGFKFIKKN